jgi:hypothetical protein
MKNQQQVGICWAFALSTTMENAIRRQGRQDLVSPLHAVSTNQWDELWTNAPPKSRPLTTESAWPYDPKKACAFNEDSQEVWCEKSYGVRPGSWRSDPELVSEAAHADAVAQYRIVAVEHLRTEPVDPEELIAILANGEDVWASFGLEWRAWDYRGTGPDGVIPDYFVEDTRHAVVISGYRTTGLTRQFLLHNSWGETWANGGFAWISEAMVRTFLRRAFTIQVAPLGSAPLPGPAPAPQPQPAPSTGGCPAGHVPDAVLRTCVAACPNGSAPAVGFCLPSGSQPVMTSCPSGQVRDMLTGACLPLCPTGQARVGGACLPIPTGVGW